MAGTALVGNVGAGLSEAQFQVQYQVQVLKMQQGATEDLGAAALKLLRSALTDTGASSHDLDVLA